MNPDNRPRTTVRSAAIAALALILAMFGLAACSSSDSDSGDTSKGDTSGQAQGDGSADDAAGDDSADDDSADDADASGNRDGLDADWPDVPMPDYDKVTGGSSDDNYWNALLIVDPMMSATADEMLSDYRAKLEAAGFSATEEDEPEFLSYDNDSYKVEAYSTAAGMLSVTVSIADA